MKTMKVVVIKPGQQPEVAEVKKDSLQALQELVGGYIQEVPLFPKRRYTVYVNEDGMGLALPFNRNVPVNLKNTALGYHELIGNIVIMQQKGLSDDLVKSICEEWKQ